MIELKQGDEVKEVDCPSCGGKGHYKISKNGGIYFYCLQTIIPDIREKCGFRAFFGRHQSQMIIQEYIDNAREFENNEIENTTTTITGYAEPEPEREPIPIEERGEVTPEPDAKSWADKPIGELARGFFGG